MAFKNKSSTMQRSIYHLHYGSECRELVTEFICTFLTHARGMLVYVALVIFNAVAVVLYHKSYSVRFVLFHKTAQPVITEKAGIHHVYGMFFLHPFKPLISYACLYFYGYVVYDHLLSKKIEY